MSKFTKILVDFSLGKPSFLQDMWKSPSNIRAFKMKLNFIQNKGHPVGINLLSNSSKEFHVTNSGKEMLSNTMPDSAIQRSLLQTGANAQNEIRPAHTRITHTLLQKGVTRSSQNCQDQNSIQYSCNITTSITVPPNHTLEKQFYATLQGIVPLTTLQNNCFSQLITWECKNMKGS